MRPEIKFLITFLGMCGVIMLGILLFGPEACKSKQKAPVQSQADTQVIKDGVHDLALEAFSKGAEVGAECGMLGAVTYQHDALLREHKIAIVNYEGMKETADLCIEQAKYRILKKLEEGEGKNAERK